MILYAHRGLDLDRAEKLPENSLAAFEWAGRSGFGIELDLQLTSDGVMIVSHDPVSGAYASKMPKLESVCALARKSPAMHLAVHVKGANQYSLFIDRLIAELAPYADLHARILLFDLLREPAVRLCEALPTVNLAPSVAHQNDIARFQHLTRGTLCAVDEILKSPEPFNWLWLDEWDRAGGKALYTRELFAVARARGLKLAVISPELHKGEKHEDAESLDKLAARWREILQLKPDAVCTDYPARLSASLKTS